MGLVFDAWLRIATIMVNPEVSDYIDDIETEVSAWQNIRTCIHKYGGLQFNYGSYELGHIHGNGLLDMRLSRKEKQRMMAEDDRILHHHVFKSTGWISLYIKSEDDAAFALQLLKMAYDNKMADRRYDQPA
jgi:hypothetical protein